LRRLKTDWIDLYQLHNFDARTPLEETLRALDDLITAGKIRYIGCSNYAAWQLMKALAISNSAKFAPLIGHQIQYSLMVREPEAELLPCGIDQGVGALVWSPLAGGFLTGKFRSQREGITRLDATGGVAKYDNPEDQAVLTAINAIVQARHESVSPSQVALNWVQQRPGVTSVLIGARTEEQLQDNLAAAKWQLTDAEMKALDRASQKPWPYPVSHHYIWGSDRNSELFPRHSPEE
jgi:aryl-alcohol dehydrogenase-like predicted oxidoreductase